MALLRRGRMCNSRRPAWGTGSVDWGAARTARASSLSKACLRVPTTSIRAPRHCDEQRGCAGRWRGDRQREGTTARGRGSEGAGRSFDRLQLYAVTSVDHRPEWAFCAEGRASKKIQSDGKSAKARDEWQCHQVGGGDGELGGQGSPSDGFQVDVAEEREGITPRGS